MSSTRADEATAGLRRKLHGRRSELEQQGPWPAQAKHLAAARAPWSGAGARAVNQYGHGRRRRNMAEARGELVADELRTLHQSTLGAASSMASGSRWVSMRMAARSGVAPNETGAPRRSGDAPGDDGGAAWPGLANEKRRRRRRSELRGVEPCGMGLHGPVGGLLG